jgi:hypothetical protein
MPSVEARQRRQRKAFPSCPARHSHKHESCAVLLELGLLVRICHPISPRTLEAPKCEGLPVGFGGCSSLKPALLHACDSWGGPLYRFSGRLHLPLTAHLCQSPVACNRFVSALSGPILFDSLQQVPLSESGCHMSPLLAPSPCRLPVIIYLRLDSSRLGRDFDS